MTSVPSTGVGAGRVPRLLLLGLGMAALLRVAVVLHRAIDPDESQHLHAAWRVAQGLVPHRDFWEHHVALFYYLLAPVTVLFAERPAVYLGARALMVLLAAAGLALTWRLGTALSRPAAAIGVVVLAFLPEFTEHSTETRPDVAAWVAWLGLLLALVLWRTEGRARWLWTAGIAGGTALALTTKAVFGLGGAVALLLADVAWPPAGDRPRGGGVARLVVLWPFAAGALVVPAGLLGLLAAGGGWAALSAMAGQVLRDNLRFVDFVKMGMVGSASRGFALAALAGLALSWARHGPGLVRHPVHGVLLVPGLVVALGLSLPWTPAIYRHGWLPVWPLLAIYAGLAGEGLLAWAAARPGLARRLVVGLAVVLALLVPAAETVYGALRDQASGQLALMERLLAHACPGEAVLDGTALAVFRPSAYRYGALITGVREWIARGVIAEEEIEADVRRARPPVGYPDRRLRGLIGPLADLIERHYVREGDLLLAGAAIRASGGAAGGRAYVEVLVPGRYRLAVDPGIQLAVDREAVSPGWIELEAGRHEVTWVGGPGGIRLTIGSCAERGGRPGAAAIPLTLARGGD